MAFVFQVSTMVWCLLPAIALSAVTRQTKDCKDLMETKRCRDAERRYQICREEKGRSFCQKTCNFCHLKAPAPEVPCQDTALGCCWDGVTRKQGLSNEGCPVCKDREEYVGLCSRWKIYCGGNRGPKIYHNVVNQFCHRTCGRCNDSPKTGKKMRDTLAPIILHESTSADKPRWGSMYVWTKVAG